MTVFPRDLALSHYVDIVEVVGSNPITALVCALAHDEAAQRNADTETLVELRGHWVLDAKEVIDKAERLGIWGDFDE